MRFNSVCPPFSWIKRMPGSSTHPTCGTPTMADNRGRSQASRRAGPTPISVSLTPGTAGCCLWTAVQQVTDLGLQPDDLLKGTLRGPIAAPLNQTFEFIDDQSGWGIGGSGQLYVTQDSGRTWTPLAARIIP